MDATKVMEVVQINRMAQYVVLLLQAAEIGYLIFFLVIEKSALK